jgi:4-hydroxy-tetrahydrodipicolinate synthase
MTMTLKGLSAFPITPCSPDGRVDAGSMRRLLAPLLAAEVDSIGLLGSTGSYPYVTREERRRALDLAIDEASGRVPILVGVGALRTDEAIRLAQDAKAAGAEAGLLAAVSYTPLNEEEVFQHFVAVARGSGLPLCIYDNPGTTHFTFTPALIGRLGHVPGVIAVKSPRRRRR